MIVYVLTISLILPTWLNASDMWGRVSRPDSLTKSYMSEASEQMWRDMLELKMKEGEELVTDEHDIVMKERKWELKWECAIESHDEKKKWETEVCKAYKDKREKWEEREASDTEDTMQRSRDMCIDDDTQRWMDMYESIRS